MSNAKDELIKYMALAVLLAGVFSCISITGADAAGSWLYKADAAVASVIRFVAEEQPHVK